MTWKIDIIDQLKLLETGRVSIFPRDQTIRAARGEIEQLRALVEDACKVFDHYDLPEHAFHYRRKLVPSDDQSALTPIETHNYFPSAMHMGDCAVCGHVQDADIHKR